MSIKDIEKQGYDFVQAMIPLLGSTSYADKAKCLWNMSLAWRGHLESPRKSPEEWLSYVDGHLDEYAFAAGAERAVREWEATK